MAAAPDVDAADHRVAECARMYSAEQWLQPRSQVSVQLAKLQEETRCPMCFDKIRNARISKICLHRYCAKCIEQYLRTKLPGRHGDEKECPVCRAHLHSRRATKPDPGFDKIIKALYGDVDQYDAEEDALIAQNNQKHIEDWQAHLTVMKAKQAAAAAAARADSLQAQLEMPATAAALGRPPVPQARNSSVGGKKCSWSTFEQFKQQQRRPGSGRPKLKLKRAASASGHLLSGCPSSIGVGSTGWDVAAGRASRSSMPGSLGDATYDAGDADAALVLASLMGTASVAAAAAAMPVPTTAAAAHSADDRQVEELRPMASVNTASSSGPKKRKKSTRDTAAKMLSMAAQAVAATPVMAQCCLVHLESAGVRERSPVVPVKSHSRRKPSHGQSQQQQEQQQQLQPYLTCPLQLTVGSLKELLQQQLQQGRASAGSITLLPPQQQQQQQWGAAAAAPDLAASQQPALADHMTVGQLWQNWGLGPEVRLQYKLHNSIVPVH